MKEIIKEASLKKEDLQANNNSYNCSLNEKEMLINIHSADSADLENTEVKNNQLESFLEKEDNEIKERDALIESPTINLESFKNGRLTSK